MHIVQYIIDSWEKLLSDLDEKKREKYGLVLHRLMESLRGLELRAKELVDIERQIVNFDDTNNNLDNTQINYLNKIEAYHQQVYATLSNLIMATTYFGIRGKKLDHPIGSVEKFLNFILKNITLDNLGHDGRFKITINVLIKSIIFRSKHIDHPQQNKTYHWMTYHFCCRCYIIYYIPKSRCVYAMDLNKADPESPKFKPPVDCDVFTVCPYWGQVQQAVIDLVSFLLSRK